MPRSTVNPREIEHFNSLASTWWDEQGPMQPLHRMNFTRMGIIRRWLAPSDAGRFPLKGKKILDVGCGAGIAAEPLARLGATVTGIDAAADNIAAASAHARQSGLDIRYVQASAEDFLTKNVGAFDAVLGLEIIEHVDHPELFVETLVKLTRPGGTVVLSTLNRTAKSWALGVLAAEYILRWLPAGTHDWKKFKKPSELAAMLKQSGADPYALRGIRFDPRSRQFDETENVDINYLIAAIKRPLGN